RRVEDDAVPSGAQAMVELEVLVRREILSPTAEREQERRREATERDGIDVAARLASGWRAPDPRVANSERGGQRRPDGTTPGAGTARQTPAADVCGTGFLVECAEAGREVAGQHLGMCVEAHDHAAA